jgi:hypothetical protein
MSDEQKILDIKVRYEDAIKGITEYNRKIDELRVNELKLKAQYKQGTISQQEYSASMEATGAVIKQYKENVRVLQKEIQNNLRTEQEMEGSLKQLRAQLSNATKAYDEMSRVERNSAKGKELQAHIKQITAELKGAEAETDRFYRNVGNYEQSIINAIGGNNRFASSLFTMMKNGEGAGGMLSSLSVNVAAFGKALLGLLANPVFAVIAGIVGAGMAFKFWFDYNKGIEEATRLTREFLGISGDRLTNLRSEIQATADVFGKDYKEVLQGVDTLVAQFHLSAEDALDVVKDGFQSGADLSGDMLAKIQQYAPTFHDAGIEASEMVAIIAQTRSGIFSDKGMDVITMASKRIREMSTATASSLDAIGISSKQVEKDLQSGAKSTFDVIQEISGKLRELPQDSQEVGAVLKDVFGKQGAGAGIQLIERLDTMKKDIEEVKKVTGEYGELQREQIETQAELNKVTAALFDMSQDGFGEMILQAKIFATKSLTEIIKNTIKLINWFIDLYNESLVVRAGVQSIAVGFKQTWSTAKLLFNLIIDGVKAAGRGFKGLATILEGLVTFSLSKVKDGFSQIMNNYSLTIKESMGDVKTFGKDYADTLVDAFNNTVKNKKIEHITIPADVNGGDRGGSGSGSAGGRKGGGSGSGSAGGSKDGKGGKSSSTSNGMSATEIAKREQAELRKAEDLLTQIVLQTAEERRKVLERSYDRQIEDVRTKLQTEKNLTETMREAMNAQILYLEKIKEKKLAEFDSKAIIEEVNREQARIEIKLSWIKKETDEAYTLRLTQLANEQKVAEEQAKLEEVGEEERQQNLLLIRQKYGQLMDQLLEEQANARIKKEEEAIKKEYETKILEAETEVGNKDMEMDKLRLQMEERKALLDAAQQLEGETEAEFYARKLQMQSDYNEAKRELNEKEVEVEQAKYEAIGNLMNGLSSIADAFGDQSKTLAKASKILALGEIAINTGKAIAAGVAQAQSVGYPANILAIATTVATIMANVATAIKTVKSAKFAHGGAVYGSGTATSDSIPARLSNGESVMTAAATSMFAPALSAMNQLGGGVPIVVSGGQSEIGEEMLANAFAKGMARSPRPVVSVEEINNVQARVETLENLGAV